MNNSLALASLSVPAMMGAGLSSGAHCAVMCGLLQARQSGAAAIARHLGRLGAYVLLGAIAGGAGQWLLRSASWLPFGEGLRTALLPILLLLLLLRSQRRAPAACCVPPSRSGLPRQAMAGLVTGLVPCVPLYAAAGYAVLSASAASGALLLLAFGIGTIPPVQAGAWAWARAGQAGRKQALRNVPLLVGLVTSTAALLMWLALARSAPWCLS
ncbi:hypothetical protein B1810_11130 [Panacagrimonas perspica]|uniref:sulfite exporter TauE/SafE family protein n=1 Tax=Panacagrimonas perspica TaxID=381431 RepID=UPI00105B497D|nr:sulfite exporter TauE/SafE family protein [Panacagrimonas perspica]THD03130.1 hypothetical protein B1810_11130 [Panacagrimonas perspica]